MTTNLDGQILEGELRLHGNRLRGVLHLASQEQQVILDLTVVNPSGLEGCAFYFTAPDTGQESKKENKLHLAPEQIGPLGTCCLCGPKDESQTPDGLEYDCLFIEWYSQNGHITFRIQNPFIEYLHGSQPVESSSTPEDLYFTQSILARTEIHSPIPTPLSADQRPDVMAEIIEMDNWIESGDPGTSVREQFKPRLNPAPPNTLFDGQLEDELKILLAQLARLAITLEWCEHFNTRTAYEYLVNTVLNEHCFAGFLPFHSVRHFSTWDDCPECQAEFDDELEGRYA